MQLFSSVKLLATLAGVLVLSTLYSQVNIPFEEAFFQGKSAELQAAKAKIKEGDRFYMKGTAYFDKALEQYLQAMAFNPNNAELNFLVGNCYVNLSQNKLKSIPYLERAIQLSPTIVKEYHQAMAKAYHYSLSFDKAIKHYDQYIELIKNNPKLADEVKATEKRIVECESGMKLLRKPVRVRIDNLGSGVNSKFPEYAPVIDETEQKLLFTSRREGSIGGFVDPIDSLWMEDVYITFKVDDIWQKAKNLGKPINTNDHDASVNLSPDGNKLLIYRVNNGGDLLESKLDNRKVAWSDPKSLEFINSKFYENHATYSPDGSRIYFISNRPDDNFGGKDIYYVENNGGESWGPATNLGKTINTPYDEDGLYMHPDGKTLYFCSKGHNSMGGFDIFYSVLENGEWTAPVNMGYPINSPDDDLYFVISKDKKRAYFSSYREEGYGDKDIYVMNFLDETELMVSIQALITGEDQEKLNDALVEIRDVESGKVIAKASTKDLNGEVLFNLPAGKKYELTVTSGQYVAFSELLDIPYSAGDQIMTRAIQLSRDKRITLSGFVFDESTLIQMDGRIEFIDAETGEWIAEAYANPKNNYQFKAQLPNGRKLLASVYASGYSKSSQSIDLSDALPGSEITKSFGLRKVNRNMPSMLDLAIVDAKTGKPLLNPVIKIQEVDGEPTLVYKKNAGYDCVIYPGQHVKITVSADDYMTYEEFFDVPYSNEKIKINRTIKMAKLTTGSKIVIRNIFFDFNKSTLRPNSFEALSHLKTTLNRYGSIKVELTGHTDNVGNLDFNQKLSENRAKVVYEYLLRNGIDSKRISYSGKAFTEPIAPNDTDENRQLNRRTELYILAR